MTVGVGKRTRVAPRLLSGLRDDLATCLVRTLDQLVNVGLGLSTQAEHALALAAPGHLAVADDPAEAASGDQHEAHAIVEIELQRLRHSVIRYLADGVEAEAFTVENANDVRRSAVGRLTMTRESGIGGAPLGGSNVALGDYDLATTKNSSVAPPPSLSQRRANAIGSEKL
jgi:hypothetical protein